MKSSTRNGSRPRRRNGGFGSGLAYAALLIALAIAHDASAEGSAADNERANLLFKRGKIAYNAGRYNDALRIYNEAWGLKKSPDIAANLAQTESELGKHREAAEHFAFALAHLLPSSTDEQKAALAEGLDVEKQEIGSLHVTLEPADSTLLLDDQPLALPPGGEVFVEAGDHRATISHDGYEASQQTLRISKGAAQVLWIKLQPLTEPAATATPLANVQPAAPAAPTHPEPTLPPASSNDQRSLVPVILGGGLVAVGATVGIVFLLSANSSQTDADALHAQIAQNDQNAQSSSACGNGSVNATDCARLHDKNSDVDSERRIELTGFAVAGAAAIGTALYWLWPQSTSSSTATIHWQPTLAAARGVTGLGLTGRF